MGIDKKSAAHGITDLVRYTATFEPDKLVEGANATHKALETQGYTQYDTKWRNYWSPGNDYQGYNCVYENKKTGLKFELQFHTKQSLAIKEENHKLYKTSRELPEGPERHALIVKMRDNWKPVVRPPGWEKLPGIVIAPKV